MRRTLACGLLAGLVATAVATVAPAADSLPAQDLTAAQIVDKNVAARGGLAAWRRIDTMVWVGHVESGNAQVSSAPFSLDLKRPGKERFEMTNENQTSVRIFDGIHGWKMHSGSGGRPQWQPYTEAETRFSRDTVGIESPLMDYQAKGIAVALEGLDEVDGRQAYRLNLRLRSGNTQHVWIDAQSFLDIKAERSAGDERGAAGTVSVSYHDFRATDGVQIPYRIESAVAGAKMPDTLVLDRILLNRPLDDRMFVKPAGPGDALPGAGSRMMTRRPGGPMPSAIRFPAGASHGAADAGGMRP